MSASNGDYYLPDPSPWPLVASVGLFVLAGGFVMLLNDFNIAPWVMLAGGLIIAFMMFGWFGVVVLESEGGRYNAHVDISFRMGMLWFIFSEVMFFGGFFGALFYLRNLAIPWLSETDLLWMGFDGGWPTAGPMGPEVIAADSHAGAGQFSTIGAWGIPIWNTLILLSSSVTVTIAHWALKKDQRKPLIGWLIVTVVLGFLFLYLQATEYVHAYSELGLTLGTGVYGATFFLLTGFHGAHVTIGAIILTVILIRSIRGHFKPDHHFGFEAAAWYWHFVDTVWVGLFIFVYVV
jgi:cytochrome c oxidase subunit 3